MYPSCCTSEGDVAAFTGGAAAAALLELELEAAALVVAGAVAGAVGEVDDVAVEVAVTVVKERLQQHLSKETAIAEEEMLMRMAAKRSTRSGS